MVGGGPNPSRSSPPLTLALCVAAAPPAARPRGATTLLRRLEQTHAAHAAVRHLLPAVPGAADVQAAYELTHQSVQQFIVTTHTEWFATIDPGLPRLLAAPLLTQDRADREPPRGRRPFSLQLQRRSGRARPLEHDSRRRRLAAASRRPAAGAAGLQLPSRQGAPSPNPLPPQTPPPNQRRPPPPQAACCLSTLPRSCCR
jgi:hypothetical protein